MKHIATAVLAIALSVVPCLVAADPSDSTPSPQMRAAFASMRQAREKTEQLHAQARLQALNTLSAAHRTLLAQVVGQLAIASTPNVAGAARSLDNALSASESKSILNIASSAESQSRQIMEAARQQMMAARPSGSPGPGGPWMGGPGAHGFHHGMSGHGHAPTDAGMILLLMSTHALQPMGFHRPG